MHNLSVIIPFYNEHKFLLDSINSVLEIDIANQIILSDDFSNDGSEKIAEKLSEEYEFISYIRSNENKGKGNALNNAKDYIKTSHVVIHDADLEYFPSDIIEMYEVSKDYPESLILGTRFKGNKIRKNVYFRTGLANKVMSLFFSMVNFYKVSDVATCYKLMPTEFFQSIRLNEQGFSIEIEILSKFLKTKNKIKEVQLNTKVEPIQKEKKLKLQMVLSIYLIL